MRIVVKGDRSKYQFLGEMVDLSDYKEEFGNSRSKWLASHRIIVQRTRRNEGGQGESGEYCFFSGKLPLYTELIFPREGEEGSIRNSLYEKVLIFDEFPYKRGSDVQEAKRLQQKYSLASVAVILYQNDRDLLESDTTTEGMALEEAYEEYQKSGIRAYIYKPGGKKTFLYWGSKNIKSHLASNKKREVRDLRENLEVTYKIEYELSFLALEELIGQAKQLNELVTYREDIGNRAVAEVYYKNARACFLEHRSQIMDIIFDTYKRCFGQAFMGDEKKDRAVLEKKAEDYFHEQLKCISPVVFTGKNKEQYIYFLNKNHIDVQFQNRFLAFFKEDLRQLVWEEINRKINKMEALLNEKS